MGKRSVRLGTAAAITLLTLSPAVASAEPLRELCVDRPGKDTPPCIVDKGHLVLEVGKIRYSRDEEDGVETRTYSASELLARVGLTDSVEVQLGFTPFNVVKLKDATGRRRFEGVGDLTGAVKVNMLNPDGSGTSATVQAFVTAPTGATEIGSGGWEGGVIVPVSFELSDKLGLTLDPEVDVRRNENGGGHHLAFAGVASLGRDLGGGVEGSAELWSMVDRDPAGHRTEASVDLALAWIPERMPNLQLDAEVDFGVTKPTAGIEATAGFAYRF